MSDDPTQPGLATPRPGAGGAAPDPNATHDAPADVVQPFVRVAGVRQSEPRIAHLRIERELGGGGMGVVYSVLNQRTGRREALKVPRDAVRDAPSLDRFRREYVIQQGLGEHPNLVRVYETGTFVDSAGVEKPYYTMECIEGGRTLRTLIDEGTPRRRLVEIMERVADVVAHASRNHVHHGDLKPSNVLIRDNGEPAVSDFGVARNLSVEQTLREVTASLGRAIGTHDYMSPEQASSASALASQTDDVYSLGVMLYEVIAGRRPYAVQPGPDGSVAEAIRRAHVAPLRVGAGEPGTRKDRDRPADPWITRIVSKAMAKEASGRYESAREVQGELARYLSLTRWTTASQLQASIPSPKRFWISAGGAAAVALLVGLWLLMTGVLQIAGLTEAYKPVQTHALGSPGLDDIRVIAITDETPVAELSKKFAPHLPPAGQRMMYPFRAVQAELARRLISARTTVVAWDFSFPAIDGSEEVDTKLAQAITALRESGTPTLIVATNWRRVDGMPVDVSPEIARAALSFGGVTAQLGAEYPWKVDALVQVGPEHPVEASLSMLAFSSFIRPGARFDATIDARRPIATLQYWKPQPLLPGGRELLGAPVRLTLSHRESVETGDGPAAIDQLTGLTPISLAVHTMLDMPPMDALERITVPIEHVLEMDEASLRERFMGKAVFVGDLQTPYDQKALPASAGGGYIAGVYVQVVATANLLAGLVPALPGRDVDLVVLSLAIAAFVVPVIAFRLPWWGAALWSVAAMLLVLGTSWLVVRQSNMLIDPWPLVVAGALAWVGTLCARAYVQRQWSLER